MHPPIREMRNLAKVPIFRKFSVYRISFFNHYRRSIDRRLIALTRERNVNG